MNNIIEIALSQYGIKEIPGEEHNPEILKYFDEIGHAWIDDDETAWCSAYVNWVVQKAGYENSGKLNARSWLDVGKTISTDPAQLGDIVIFWRVKPNSWQGHVGFYINEDAYNYYILGGNQSNKVCIKPYDKGRLLGIRRIDEDNVTLPPYNVTYV